MGDAQVASTDDAFSTFWNPAGLAAAEVNSVSVSYYAWVLDTGSYSAATRLGFGSNGAIGLFATAMGSGDLEARSAPGEPEGTFGVQFISTGASYGRQIGPLRVGATAKYLSERIFTRTSHGYAIDLGVQADIMSEGFRAGFVLQNVGEMSELDRESTNLPRAIRAGLAFRPLDILLSEDDASLARTVAIAEVAHFLETEETQIHLGVGVEILDTIDLRAGYITNDELRGASFGLGFGLEGAVFDYAYIPFQSGFEGPGHMLTLTYTW